MSQHNLLSNEDNARLELYSEVQKGLHAIHQGRTKTSIEVRRQMEERRKDYHHAKV